MYRTIDTATWNDPAFKSLPPECKLLFLYLVTNHHAHVGGIYVIANVTIAHETGLPLEKIDTLLDTLSRPKTQLDKLGLVLRDLANDVIWVVKMLKRQGRGEKILRSVSKQLKTLHNCSLIPKFLESYPSIKRYFRDRVSDGVSSSRTELAQSGIQEQEQEQELNTLSPSGDGGSTKAKTSAISPKVRGKAKPAVSPKADSDTRQLADFFRSQWRARHGADYAWVYGKDDKHAKWILERVEKNLERAKGVCKAFLADQDEWLTAKCHTINILVSRFNQYQGIRPTAPAENGFVRAPLPEGLLAELGLGEIDPEVK